MLALITGSSRGIGAASALLFAEKGFDVCINYVSQKEKAEKIVEQARSLGVRAEAIQADVSQEAEVIRLFEQMDLKLGRLDVLVNNAGILMPQMKVRDMQADRINKMLTINVTSGFLCAREAIKRMSVKDGGVGGVIINVSSAAARIGAAGEYVDYAASKGAMDTFTQGLALEVAQENIRVNGVRPGFIYTDIHADGGEPGRVDRIKGSIPLQRGGTPLEIAQAIYWLSSSESSFITGSTLDIAGGR